MTAPIMITVAEKKQPKQGAKTFQITDEGGVQWYMWLDQWGHVQSGDMLRVESYKTKPFQGNEYHYIDKYQLVNGGDAAPAPAPRPAAAMPPPRPTMQIRSPMPPSPRTISPPTPYVPPPPQNKDKHIYVCGVVNSLLANPNFVPESLTEAWLVSMTRLAMSTYDKTLGMKMITTGADLVGELNDEIPFP